MRIYPESIHKLHEEYVLFKSILPINKYPLHGSDRYSPFFIVGCGRSGNTLLRKLLNNHSCVHIPPETYVLGAVIKRFRQQNRVMKWPDLVEYIFSAFEFYPEFETFHISLRPLVNELKSINTKDKNLAYLLGRFYHFCSDKSGKKCIKWGDKTPLNTFYLERIHTVFPDAKFIYMLRDGADVIPSYLHSGIYGTIESAAERWTQSNKLVEEFYRKYPESVLTVRYEELVKDTTKILQEICSFIDINFESGMLAQNAAAHDMGDVEMRAHHSNVLNPINSNSIGKGRSSLTPGERIKIQQMIGKELERLGYDKCTY